MHSDSDREYHTYKNNYAPKAWYLGVDKDLIDHKALKDSSLSRRENTANLRSMGTFKNIRF